MKIELKKKIQKKIDQGAKTIGDIDLKQLKREVERKEKTVEK